MIELINCKYCNKIISIDTDNLKGMPRQFCCLDHYQKYNRFKYVIKSKRTIEVHKLNEEDRIILRRISMEVKNV